jgi:hypothetical protein
VEQLLLAPTRRDEWSGSGNNDEDETNGLRNEREREGANAWVVVVVVVLVEREAATAKAATVNFMADDFGCDSIRCFVNEEMSGDAATDEETSSLLWRCCFSRWCIYFCIFGWCMFRF